MVVVLAIDNGGDVAMQPVNQLNDQLFSCIYIPRVNVVYGVDYVIVALDYAIAAFLFVDYVNAVDEIDPVYASCVYVVHGVHLSILQYFKHEKEQYVTWWR